MLLPDNGPPVTPGELLLEEFLKPLGVSQRMFAKHLGWQINKLNEIINGKRGISPEVAMTLADALDTTPEFWLNSQMVVDMWKARQLHKPAPKLRIAG